MREGQLQLVHPRFVGLTEQHTDAFIEAEIVETLAMIPVTMAPGVCHLCPKPGSGLVGPVD